MNEDKKLLRVFMLRAEEDSCKGAVWMAAPNGEYDAQARQALWVDEFKAAVAVGNKESVAELADKARHGEGLSGMMAACAAGLPDCARAIKSWGGFAAEMDLGGFTALTWAARGGDESCVRLSLNGGSLGARDASGWSALFWGSAEGRSRAVEIIAGASSASQLAQKDANGMTALSMAAICGHMKCLRALSREIEAKCSKGVWRCMMLDASDAADQMGQPQARDFLLSKIEQRALVRSLPRVREAEHAIRL
jgi:ankyrin repeat protein